LMGMEWDGGEVPVGGEAIRDKDGGRGGVVIVRRCLPQELRIKLYDDVVALRRSGLSYNKIIDEIYRRYGVRISISSISEWLRGIRSPYNGRRIPSLELLKPSVELAYVIGVVLGDGYIKKKSRVREGYNHVIIRLEAKDKEFVEEFGRCLSVVLGRGPIKPYRLSSRIYDVVEVESKTLYEFLRKPVDLDRLKKYIEHCDRCTRHSSGDSRTQKEAFTRKDKYLSPTPT
jgi:intein-encoded DNA endonuclease-like protein